MPTIFYCNCQQWREEFGTYEPDLANPDMKVCPYCDEELLEEFYGGGYADS